MSSSLNMNTLEADDSTTKITYIQLETEEAVTLESKTSPEPPSVAILGMPAGFSTMFSNFSRGKRALGINWSGKRTVYTSEKDVCDIKLVRRDARGYGYHPSKLDAVTCSIRINEWFKSSTGPKMIGAAFDKSPSGFFFCLNNIDCTSLSIYSF